MAGNVFYYIYVCVCVSFAGSKYILQEPECKLAASIDDNCVMMTYQVPSR